MKKPRSDIKTCKKCNKRCREYVAIEEFRKFRIKSRGKYKRVAFMDSGIFCMKCYHKTPYEELLSDLEIEKVDHEEAEGQGEHTE